jgi:hypothetical protein
MNLVIKKVYGRFICSLSAHPDQRALRAAGQPLLTDKRLYGVYGGSQYAHLTLESALEAANAAKSVIEEKATAAGIEISPVEIIDSTAS